MIKDIESLKLVSRINSKENMNLDFQIVQLDDEKKKGEELVKENQTDNNSRFVEQKSLKIINSENLQKKIKIAIVF